jgi:hypothetical protein
MGFQVLHTVLTASFDLFPTAALSFVLVLSLLNGLLNLLDGRLNFRVCSGSPFPAPHRFRYLRSDTALLAVSCANLKLTSKTGLC